jgi:hypothetical protein
MYVIVAAPAERQTPRPARCFISQTLRREVVTLLVEGTLLGPMRSFLYLQLPNSVIMVGVIAKCFDGMGIAVGAGATGPWKELLPSFRP